MLRDFLTPEAFEIGIIKYLQKYSYQNTVNSHLWESLTNVSHLWSTVCVSVCTSHIVLRGLLCWSFLFSYQICSSDVLDEGRIKHKEFCSKGSLQSGATVCLL